MTKVLEDIVIQIEGRNTTILGRERALLTLLRSSTPTQIAECAQVSRSAVYAQLHALLAKLRVRSYAKAVKKAERLGLVNEAVRM